MIVVVGGMPRSGSTFSFNIVREILLLRGSVACLSGLALPDAETLQKTDHFILKTHNPSEHVLDLIRSGEVKAVCTYRKPEDATASWSDTFGFSLAESIDAIRSWILWHKSQQATHDIDYQSIEGYPLQVISHIQSYLLGIEDEAAAVRLSRMYERDLTYKQYIDFEKGDQTIDLGFSYYDPESFFHRRHVRSPERLTAQDTLNESDLELVREMFKPFVDAAGNYTPKASKVSS